MGTGATSVSSDRVVLCWYCVSYAPAERTRTVVSVSVLAALTAVATHLICPGSLTSQTLVNLRAAVYLSHAGASIHLLML
jgi:hypothetical protein